MYLQYRLTNNECNLIQQSQYLDDDVEKIISGAYDKENLTEKDLFKKYIFKSLSDKDIIIKSNFIFIHPILDGNTIREMTREEVCATGDLSILLPGEIYENGVIKTIERPQGVKIKWQYPNWVETATLEEQLEFYKQEILKANRELLVYEKAGFTNQELQIKLNELIKKHNEISFDIASEENKFF